MKKTFIAIAVSALCFASCNNCINTSNSIESDSIAIEEPLDMEAIAGFQGQITELNGTALEATADTVPSILFEDGRISATVGCNIIAAQYEEAENGALTLQEGLSTKMLCPDVVRESEFIEAFNKVARYSVVGGTEYSFLDAEGTVLFKAVKAEK